MVTNSNASLIDTSLNVRVTRCPKTAVAMHKHATINIIRLAIIPPRLHCPPY